MKKAVIGILAASLFVGTAGLSRAQTKASVSLNLGVQANIQQDPTVTDYFFTADLRAGFALGRAFEIGPEVMYAVDSGFDFDINWLFPGVMINYRSKKLFAGVGLVVPFVFEEGGESAGFGLSPKIDLGHDFGRLKLTAYFLSILGNGSSLFESNTAGVTIGYRF